jgi:hypothetical protein
MESSVLFVFALLAATRCPNATTFLSSVHNKVSVWSPIYLSVVHGEHNRRMGHSNEKGSDSIRMTSKKAKRMAPNISTKVFLTIILPPDVARPIHTLIVL